MDELAGPHTYKHHNEAAGLGLCENRASPSRVQIIRSFDHKNPIRIDTVLIFRGGGMEVEVDAELIAVENWRDYIYIYFVRKLLNLRQTRKKMSLSLKKSPSCTLYKLKNPGQNKFASSSLSSLLKGRSSNSSGLRWWNNSYTQKNGLKACFSPIDEPILKEALKEPVAFVGGMFAGLLRLDLNDDPLKEWVTRTVESAGITEEEIEAEGSKPEEEVPELIEIE